MFIIKHATQTVTIFILIIIIMLKKYNSSKKTNLKNKKKIKKIHDDEFCCYGQYVIIDNYHSQSCSPKFKR